MHQGAAIGEGQCVRTCCACANECVRVSGAAGAPQQACCWRAEAADAQSRPAPDRPRDRQTRARSETEACGGGRGILMGCGTTRKACCRCTSVAEGRGGDHGQGPVRTRTRRGARAAHLPRRFRSSSISEGVGGGTISPLMRMSTSIAASAGSCARMELAGEGADARKWEPGRHPRSWYAATRGTGLSRQYRREGTGSAMVRSETAARWRTS